MYHVSGSSNPYGSGCQTINRVTRQSLQGQTSCRLSVIFPLSTFSTFTPIKLSALATPPLPRRPHFLHLPPAT